MIECMLSTSDNPYNPFDDWDSWYAYDERAGYHTPSYLARIVRSSPDLSEANESFAIESAIDEIVELNILGIYIKVTKEFEEDKAVIGGEGS